MAQRLYLRRTHFRFRASGKSSHADCAAFSAAYGENSGGSFWLAALLILAFADTISLLLPFNGPSSDWRLGYYVWTSVVWANWRYGQSACWRNRCRMKSDAGS